MAAYDRFLIAPLDSGLQLNVKPFLISNDAYEQLDNAYMFRGRLRKRFGGTYMGTGAPTNREQFHSRLRMKFTAFTDLKIPVSGAVPGAFVSTRDAKIGMAFSVGSVMLTVTNSAGGAQTLTTTDSSLATGTFNNINNNFEIIAHDATMIGQTVWYYPSEPVMGLTQFGVNSSINNKPAYAFDRQFAYVFNSAGYWERSGGAVFHGSDSDFFWAANWEGIVAAPTYEQAMFVTNFNATIGTPGVNDDLIHVLKGDPLAWVAYHPVCVPTGTTLVEISSARIIVAFKNRLILLNTIEKNTTGATIKNIPHVNRCRYSHNGSPFSTNAFYEQNMGTAPNIGDGGGYLDATTDEAIISAEFIRDRLIVFFERSTWELAYTNNETQPFLWQKLNTELGCDATFSSVPFDQHILSIGQTGVHACNGSSVERIDSKIPDEIAKVKNLTDGPKRVHGVRDYFTEMVYWCFPELAQLADQPFPQRILVYNYKNQSWAFNNDCVTCFGYFEQYYGMTWGSIQRSWAQADFAWGSPITQPNFRKIIAGNQQGYVFLIEPDWMENAPVMQITNIDISALPAISMTVINHSLKNGEYVFIKEVVSTLTLATDLNRKIVQVKSVDKDTISFSTPPDTAPTGVYLGAGTLTRVSKIDIRSRQWNPYIDKGMNVNLGRIDFAVTNSQTGEITVDYSPSATNLSMVEKGIVNGSLMGTNILETGPYTDNQIEDYATRLWHSVYFMGEGECIQLRLYFTDAQMKDPTISLVGFELQGLILNTKPTSSYMQATF